MSERRLAAIMFTDMVGFSALTQQNEALALELLDEHFELLRPLIPRLGGREIKTIGDSFMAEFQSPLQAVRCAMAMQKALSIHNAGAPKDRQIHIRIGIHLGDVEHRAGDVFGDGVNIAARLQPLAEPGGICLSQHVYDHVHNKMDVPLVSMGRPELKNIGAPIEVYRVALPWQQDSAVPAKPAPAATHGAVPSSQDRKSLAVLPFVNLSPDPENEYFSDGITEELIDAFARLDGLKVISRTSVFHFKGQKVDLRTIGERLGVSTVLEGSVRKAGERLRITAQLINVADDAHLWSERYDRQMGDVFDIQEEIAQAIVRTLRPRLVEQAERPLTRGGTDNMEAYQLYLQGRFFWNRRSAGALKKAIDCFERAIALDPQYAPAYAGLADSYSLLPQVGGLPQAEAFQKAEAAALKALELNDTLAEAHTSLAFVKAHGPVPDRGRAEAGFRRAIELNPGYATAHQWYSHLLNDLWRFDESLREARRAFDLDPLSPVINIHLGYMLLVRTGRVEGALPYYQRALEIEPSEVFHFEMGLVLAYDHRFDDAIAHFRKACELSPRNIWGRLWLAAAHWFKGDIHSASDILRTLEADLSSIAPDWQVWIIACQGAVAARTGKAERARDRLAQLRAHPGAPGLAPSIAWLHTELGEIDEAFDWLERAYDQHDPFLAMMKVHPVFDAIRSDPRFTALLAKVGLGD